MYHFLNLADQVSILEMLAGNDELPRGAAETSADVLQGCSQGRLQLLVPAEKLFLRLQEHLPQLLFVPRKRGNLAH